MGVDVTYRFIGWQVYGSFLKLADIALGKRSDGNRRNRPS
jgi:hypothetical protein